MKRIISFINDHGIGSAVIESAKVNGQVIIDKNPNIIVPAKIEH